ncbi:helix-turn-helix domain-containing protein [Thermus albus]|uniref:helix-turn-helix domain-containing protein n=1 Tax=Thermus albus TaxID=2908146 RepID=UPI001FAA81B4|nr:helix-turn-helix transcriptional regulator [Thermus albus]
MVGERLRQLRERLGIGREELARLAGVSGPTVWRLEKGERGGSVEVVARLAKALAQVGNLELREVLAFLLTSSSVPSLDPIPTRSLPVRYLTVREAAKVLGVPIWEIREAVRKGVIRPRPRPGPRGATVISLEELERYAREHLEAPAGR